MCLPQEVPFALVVATHRVGAGPNGVTYLE